VFKKSLQLPFKLENIGLVSEVCVAVHYDTGQIFGSDVYKAAHINGVEIMGGGSRTVGAAGGWALGGGHSPLGYLYGMGVDSK
jgi:hypothetical protein